MLCPYCNKEMYQGFITGDGRRGATWKPEDPLSETKRVTVARFNLTSFKIKASYCNTCKKMIINL